MMKTNVTIRKSGFTLIELIGVLSIMAITASIMVPPMIQRMDEAARNREASDLRVISEGFLQAVSRTRSVPDEAGWALMVANELALPVNHVTTTPRGGPRVFLIDPNLEIGSPGGSLPYVQGTNGSVRPLNSRLIILSSLAAPVPVNSGTPASADDFNAIWNAPDKTVPATWVWNGRGEDLKIQRLNLEQVFHRLALNNVDQGPLLPYASIDNLAPPLLVSTNNPAFSSYFIEGTVVGLRGTNQVVEVREILQRDISYAFELNTWRGQIFDGRTRQRMASTEFDMAVEEFMALPRNPNAKHGATQQAVVHEMYTFMFVYALWANDCFNRYGATLPQVPQYKSLESSQTRLAANNNVADNLID
jgi:prepilin-type N-terminal cleavage/methylation domain-containing protein